MTERPGFQHDAFLYRDDDQFVGTLLPYLRDGLAGGEGVAVAAARPRIELLSDALGGDAGRVLFLPDDEWYVRPVSTIAGWSRVINAATARGHPRARLVGEVRFGGPAEHTRWVRFEAALNRALQGCPARLVCPYDVRTLPPHLLHEGRRTHRRVIADGGCDDSRFYLAPELLMAEVAEPPAPVAGPPLLDVSIGHTLAGLREHIRQRIGADGLLPPERLDDLVLAVSEIATNGVRHGAGRRSIAVWVADGAVVCEVRDEGAGPADPLAGYLPPAPGAVGGMGLWLVHQICDSLTIDPTPGRVRVRFAIHR